VFLREHGVERALPTAEIVFIESDGDYSALRLADGRRHFELRSLRTWVAQLPADQFLRVHGSYLVNVTHFERLERSARWSLHLRGIAEPIPVGRAYRSQVRQRIGF